MSVEWSANEEARQPEYVYKATVEGLELTVVDEGRWGVRWTVQCYLDDFILFAHSLTSAHLTVEEAQAKAIAAARRLLELGMRGER